MAVSFARPGGDDRDPERSPPFASDWYQERREQGEPVDVYLPFFQGDVFIGVPLESPFTEIPAPDLVSGQIVLPDAVMLVGHPCSMVAGATLLPLLEVVRVRPTRSVHFEEYGRGRFEEFFLPFADPEHPDVHYSACLHERALVPVETLRFDNRVAALSLDGVVALQQRITHEATRVVVAEHMLREATMPRFNENQFMRDWNEGVLGKLTLEPAELVERMAIEAAEFEQAVTREIRVRDEASDYSLTGTLRGEMFNAERLGSVSKAMKTLIKRRKSVVAGEANTARQLAARAASQEATGRKQLPEEQARSEG